MHEPRPIIAAAARDTDLGRADRTVWAVVILTGLPLLIASGWFTVRWLSFAGPAAATAILLAASLYYARNRGEPSLASALLATSQLVGFTAVAAPLSYIAASFGLPGHDAAFAAVDRSLGLDWNAMQVWMKAHPLVDLVLTLAYFSLTLQAAATIMGLAIARRLVGIRVFVLAFMLAALIAIAVSAVMPADGIWTIYGLHAVNLPAPIPIDRLTEDFRVLHEIRHAGYRTLMANGAEGIISFPSLHTALAIIFMRAAWPVPGLRWASLVLNLLMLVSVPVHGAHYFVDLFGGLVVAQVAWMAATQLVRRAGRRSKSATAPALQAVTR